MAERKPPRAPGAASEQAATAPHINPRRVVELMRPPPASADTVALLQSLLRQAIAGELVGIVAVTFFPAGSDRKYDLDLAGLAAANTTLAVGAMDVCHMLLREAALKDSGLA